MRVSLPVFQPSPMIRKFPQYSHFRRFTKHSSWVLAPPEPEKEPEKERIAKPRTTEVALSAQEGSEHALWKWVSAGFVLLVVVAGLRAKLRKA